MDDGRVAPAPLHGELVRLRAREAADLSTLNAMFDDPEVLAGLQMAFPQPMAGIRAWYEHTRSSDTFAVFAIETLAGREPIGICALEAIDPRSHSAEFGLWIGKAYWNRGYGTDATRTTCRFAFQQMHLHRVTLHVLADSNPKALRTYEKVGFKVEGTLRDGIFEGGRYQPLTVMGLLASEFPAT
jgi:RimJ/RimL family protein N-acetyltransferase